MSVLSYEELFNDDGHEEAVKAFYSVCFDNEIPAICLLSNYPKMPFVHPYGTNARRFS